MARCSETNFKHDCTGEIDHYRVQSKSGVDYGIYAYCPNAAKVNEEHGYIVTPGELPDATAAAMDDLLEKLFADEDSGTPTIDDDGVDEDGSDDDTPEPPPPSKPAPKKTKSKNPKQDDTKPKPDTSSASPQPGDPKPPKIAKWLYDLDGYIDAAVYELSEPFRGHSLVCVDVWVFGRTWANADTLISTYAVPDGGSHPKFSSANLLHSTNYNEDNFGLDHGKYLESLGYKVEGSYEQ